MVWNLHSRKNNNILSLVTAYQTCAGSRQTASLGSTFHRETEYFINQARDAATHSRLQHNSISARQRFLTDMVVQIRALQEDGHAVVLMLDANATITDDAKFQDMVDQCDLIDMHRADPATSTYIGARARRIDYIFGCNKVMAAMTRQGTLAYHEGPQSDHRALYVDLDAYMLLTHHARDNAIQTPQARVLKTGNPEAVAIYQTKMKEYYDQHNMFKRIKKLHKMHSELTDDKVRVALEKWDRDQGGAMRHAEKALGSIRLKKHYWSPTLRNAGLLCRYWRLPLLSNRENRDVSDTIQRMQAMVQQHNSTYAFPLQHHDVSTNDIAKYWKQAKQSLKKLQKEARELRYRSYEELLEEYEADAYNPESARRAKIVRSTLRTEKCRAMYQQIRVSVKPIQENVGGLKSILIPHIPGQFNNGEPTSPERDTVYEWLAAHPDGPCRWESVIDRTEVEQYLISYNRSSFRAAATSPCGTGQVLDDLTFSTLSPAGTNLLNGVFPQQWYGKDELLREFLASFAAPSSVRQSTMIPTSVTEDDVKRGFGRWKEATSTSPSGRHLGHYRAIIQDEDFLNCLTKFLDIIVQRGISISRWKNAINVMLEKDSGRPRINRLRIIHLFEHDLKMLNTGQYGSVPGRTAIELVMLNQLSNDICRIIRFDNDASACYDRILVHLGMIAARRCGMPDNAIRLHADTLEGMKYKVKTTFGTSEKFYTGEPGAPLFGTGQGSGASPAVWLTLVVVLMNTLDRITRERITFRSPDAPDHHNRLIDAFVDDTSLAITDTTSPMEPNTMTKRMETIAQNWEKILFHSGGVFMEYGTVGMEARSTTATRTNGWRRRYSINNPICRQHRLGTTNAPRHHIQSTNTFHPNPWRLC